MRRVAIGDLWLQPLRPGGSSPPKPACELKKSWRGRALCEHDPVRHENANVPRHDARIRPESVAGEDGYADTEIPTEPRI
jgi:hypothetical protein